MTAADAVLGKLAVFPSAPGNPHVKSEEENSRFIEDVMLRVQNESIWMTCRDCRGNTSTYQPLSDHRHR
jgi:hypothetical protein